jgi:transposase InsO family protein
MNRSWAYFTPEPHCLLSQEQRWRKQAELLGLSGKARLRLKWIIFYRTVGQGQATRTAQHFGMSRSKFYYWLQRFDAGHLRRLEDDPPLPKTRRAWQPDPVMLRRMIALRREFHCQWSKLKLAAVYRERYGEPISSWQFQRCIQAFHLYRAKKITKCQGNGAPKQRITWSIRHTAAHLFSLDTILLYLNGTKRYILTAIDHTGKRGYARVYSRHTSATAKDFLERLLYLVEGEVAIILTDNGSEFQKDFAAACDQAKIRRYYTKPHTPKDNPEAERFNKTIQEEWLDHGGWQATLKDMNRSLTGWLITYNFIRPHQTLGQVPPMTYVERMGLSKRSSSSTNP